MVQSYLQWLQDSDYSPLCNLCDKSLTDESNGQCIRLICYGRYFTTFNIVYTFDLYTFSGSKTHSHVKYCLFRI